MSTCASSYRLEGLEPDNLLAFLALLGVLRALEEAERGLRDDERWWPRVSWSIGAPPWRPQLHLAKDVERPKLLDRLESGIRLFKAALDFENRKMPNFEPTEYRSFAVAISPQADARLRLDALAAVATDHTLDDDDSTSATPLCLMTGQGHQFFLKRIASVPFLSSAQAPQAGLQYKNRADDLERALFEPWERRDAASECSLRWDPEEAARQALMAGDPTDPRYRLGSEKGANRLAVIGLSILPVCANERGDVLVPGARAEPSGVALYWPIWNKPASLSAIRALLAHPAITEPEKLARFGVVTVMRARIELINRFKNVSRARPVPPGAPSD